MRIIQHKTFKKHYQKLPDFLKYKVDLAITKFKRNPFDKTLRTHSLAGTLYGKKAFWAAFDLRIIFEEYDNYIVVFVLDVGSHARIYKM